LSVFDTDAKLQITPYKNGNANASEVTIWCQQLRDWFAINKLDDKSNIPDAIRRSPLSVQAAFISGLFSTDGSVKDRDGQVSIEQVNENYIDYLMDILSMGFGMRVNKTYRASRLVTLPQGGEYETRGSYILQITGSRQYFYDRIGFAYRTKQDKLAQYLDIPGRFIYSRISSIEEGYDEVVDFQIAHDHSYLANGFVSHNSAESIQQWRKQGVKTGMISVDRTSVPYKNLRDAFNDGRIDMYPQGVLIDELFNLEYNDKQDKIDHPIGGGKDCADAVCGAYYTMLRRASTWSESHGEEIEDINLMGRSDVGDRYDDERAI
jgi:hypothetical protein